MAAKTGNASLFSNISTATTTDSPSCRHPNDKFGIFAHDELAKSFGKSNCDNEDNQKSPQDCKITAKAAAIPFSGVGLCHIFVWTDFYRAYRCRNPQIFRWNFDAICHSSTII